VPIRGKKSAWWWLAIVIVAVVLICAPSAKAQINSNNPSQILQQYRSFRNAWFGAVWPYANTLFGLLAVIEFAWSAAVMTLEKSDLQSWSSGLLRKIMWIGAFYALLVYGPQWIPAIIDSFSQLGGSAAGINGTQGLSPSDVITKGLDIGTVLLSSAGASAFLTNPGTCIAVIIAAALVVLAFVAVTIQYVVAVVESYLVVSAGVIFLGFGGSRWSTPYVERYIGLGVATGVKIMILYMLIGVGMSLSNGWLNEASGIGTSPNPSMTGFDVMGAALIFMMLCWQVPKLFAAVLGGSPALSGGDLVSTGTALVAGGAAVASLGAGVVAAAAGGASAVFASSGTGNAAASTGASSAVASVAGVGYNGTPGGGSVPPPPSPPPAPASNGTPKQPSPPSGGSSGAAAPVFSQNVASNGGSGFQPPVDSAASLRGLESRISMPSVLASVGGDSLAGSGFEGERPAAGFISHSVPVGASLANQPDSVPRPPIATASSAESTTAEESSVGGPGTPVGSSPASDVESVGPPASAKDQPPPPPLGEKLASSARRTQQVFSGAAGRFRGTRQRLGGMPSDAAPHTPPPRMPIDHSE
jgi:type IV secretion system protein TrbL